MQVRRLTHQRPVFRRINTLTEMPFHWRPIRTVTTPYSEYYYRQGPPRHDEWKQPPWLQGTFSQGWGGISMNHMTLGKTIQHAISRSVKEIRSLGISHQDLRLENILWNTELKRALIIDFHRCTLDHRPMHKRPGSLKRLRPEERESKELCGVR